MMVSMWVPRAVPVVPMVAACVMGLARPEPSHDGLDAAPRTAGPIRFEDRQRESGIHFVLDNGTTPDKPIIDAVLGGVALLDFDDDGRLDVFFTNGARIPGLAKDDPRFWNRLYRNEGGGAFRDVTERAGVRGEGYSMGATAADFDNDGWADLYVTGVNRNVLYRNQGDGTFSDVTERAGVAGDRPPAARSSGRWVRPGWTTTTTATSTSSSPTTSTGRPRTTGLRHGRQAAELPAHRLPGAAEPPLPQRGCRPVHRRVRRDGDRRPRRQGHERRGGGRRRRRVHRRLRGERPDEALPLPERGRPRGSSRPAVEAGVAYTEDGVPVSGMGTDFRDLNQDGRPDIFLTDLSGEPFPLYLNTAEGFFSPAPTRPAWASPPS